MTEDERLACAASYLRVIAGELNGLQQLGYRVKLKHNTVYSDAGYVLPTDEGYVARSLTYLHLPDEDPD